MPNVEVSCTISNCLFHKEGNLCGAEKILVDLSDNANSGRNTEFAADFDDMHLLEEKANHSAETCCQTFEPKNGRRQ
ncbi:MAG: DUF1540 domain-containing protein [Lysinibacillus sp.]